MTACAWPKPDLSALHTAFPSLSSPEIIEWRGMWRAVPLDSGSALELRDGAAARVVVCVAGYICQQRFPSSPGRPRCLRILSHGGISGLALLADQLDLGQLEIVLALVPASVLVASPEVVKSFLRTHPGAYDDLIDTLARELAIQQVRLERGTSLPVVSNLAFLLLVLATRFSQSDRPSVIPEALTSRTWLATFLGASIESLQRALRALRAERLISTDGGEVRILDFCRLQQKASVDDSTLALFVPQRSSRDRTPRREPIPVHTRT